MGKSDSDGTRRATVRRPSARAQALELIVIEGPDVGARFKIDSALPQTLVGTGPLSHLRLTDEMVSRRHCVLSPTDAQALRLLDAGSTNGTFVDGVRIRDADITGGEIIRCGSSTISVEVTETEAKPLVSAMRFGKLYGASPAMRRLYPKFEKIAMASVHLVIEGETGTGKEQLAEALHEASGAKGPFVVFDCTTISPALMEAELFGHERGAFTGAVSQRPGLFEAAEGGTLFIDEIGDLDLSLQPKLLRAIERHEVRRVGGHKGIRVNVRIIAATRRNLDREVEQGRFRDDLFHRLAIARVELPPLRDREGDVSLLARRFAEQLQASELMSKAVLERLQAYDWPGNVRELRNAVVRLAALGEMDLRSPKGDRKTTLEGPDWIDEVVKARLPFPLARRRIVEGFELRYVEAMLAEHGGSVARAAEASGVAKRYFRLIKARARKSAADDN